MKKLIIYGAGMRGKSLYTALKNTEYNVLFFVDSNTKKIGTTIEDVKVCSPDILSNYKDCNICIALANGEQLVQVRHSICNEYGFVGKELNYLEILFDVYLDKINKLSSQDNEANTDWKVIFDCKNGMVMGGIELWIEDLCVNLNKEDYNIKILSDMGQYDRPKEIMDLVEKVDIDHSESFGNETFFNVYNYLKSQMPFAVVTSFPNIVLIAASVLKVTYPEKIKIISVIHHGENIFFDENAVFKDYVDKYIGVSKEIENELLIRGIKKEHILSMTCPVKFEEVLNRGYSNDRYIRIGYAGRLVVYKKRMDLLLKLLMELKELRVNFVFEIAGEGPFKEEMINFVKENNLEESVKFLGKIERDKLYEFWKKKDICINIADCEGRCISKMEGMSAGAIPIVTDVMGMREDIDDGENGYIVPTGDYKIMAEKIRLLCDNREKLAIMGKKCHNIILSKCQMKDHVKFWDNVLQECFSNH